MSIESEEPEDLTSLYRRAFAEYGHALWNLRPVKLPTPADALAITQALRTHGHMEGRRLAERIEDLAARPNDAARVGDGRSVPLFLDAAGRTVWLRAASRRSSDQRLLADIAGDFQGRCSNATNTARTKGTGKQAGTACLRK